MNHFHTTIKPENPKLSDKLGSVCLYAFISFSFLKHGLMYPRMVSNSPFWWEWPWTSGPSVPISRVLGLLVCTTKPGFMRCWGFRSVGQAFHQWAVTLVGWLCLQLQNLGVKQWALCFLQWPLNLLQNDLGELPWLDRLCPGALIVSGYF